MTAPATSRLERVAAAAVAGVAVATATTSFHALTGLHAAVGAPGWLAPMLPIALDGMVTAASMAVVAARRARRPAGYSWFLVALFTTLSVAGNAIHAAPGGLLAAIIAATFPATLLLSFEQLLRITTLQRTTHTDQGDETELGGRDHDAEVATAGAEPSAEPNAEQGVGWRGRQLVAALLDAQARAGRDPAALTGPVVAEATGLSVRRAQELLAQLRAAEPEAQPAGNGAHPAPGRSS